MPLPHDFISRTRCLPLALVEKDLTQPGQVFRGSREGRWHLECRGILTESYVVERLSPSSSARFHDSSLCPSRAQEEEDHEAPTRTSRSRLHKKKKKKQTKEKKEQLARARRERERKREE
ncbi:hypothetical protein Mp_8g15850 [Marchantia polymorpha subsp. ruderalis]|uniref:Uncharacterized protein n=1 Tax=Marchantia polymorpha TaxID=3197 RepID=A0A2R6WKX8_MARPO|nr:hypothetical protein MARPO_0079s0027 [Marchantia polymorpha]BBN20035.1 hypothetical protein Mp_8g15850 [Marchantia polymorpha subsp. ruderalis]|eukprot:PTQ34517.1 hypothetical protein MARPO_0079s0027 [Marchantia polymorpha]